jgi:hypothetical protein
MHNTGDEIDVYVGKRADYGESATTVSNVRSRVVKG